MAEDNNIKSRIVVENPGATREDIKKLLDELKGNNTMGKLLKNSLETKEIIRQAAKSDKDRHLDNKNTLTNFFNFIRNNWPSLNKDESKSDLVAEVSRALVPAKTQAKVPEIVFDAEFATADSQTMTNSLLKNLLGVSMQGFQEQITLQEDILKIFRQEQQARKDAEDASLRREYAPKMDKKTTDRKLGLFDFGLIGGAFLGITKMVTDFFGKIKSVALMLSKMVVKPIKMLGTLLTKIPKIGPIFTKIGGIVTKVVNWVTELVKPITAFFGRMSKLFSITKLFNQISNMLGPILKPLKLIGKSLKGIPILGQVLMLVDWVIGFFNAKEITGISEDKLTLADKAKAGIANFIASFLEIPSLLGFELFKDFDAKKTYQALFGGDGFITNIQKWVESSVIPAAKKVIGNIYDSLLKRFEKLADIGAGIVSGISGWINEKIKQAGEKIDIGKELVISLTNGVTNFILELVKSLSEINVADLVSSGIDKVKSYITSFGEEEKAIDIKPVKPMEVKPIPKDIENKVENLSVARERVVTQQPVTPIVNNVTNNNVSNSPRINSPLDADLTGQLIGAF